MGRVIAVANQKGGVGKTTTAINLSACLAEKGQKVLAIDMDPQGNMTSGLGIDKDEVEKNIYDLMIGQAGVDEVLQKKAIENLDVIPTSIDLSAAEIELIGVDDKEFIIRNAVQPIKDDYDYIIIDCPPSLSMLTINAMTTADSVLVPIQCEYYALEGLSQLIHTVELVKERLNPVLEIEGTCNRTSIRRLFLEISDWLKHQVMVCRLICMIQSLQEQAHIRDWRMKL